MKKQSKKPVAIYILIFFIFFQAISGLWGGIALNWSWIGSLYTGIMIILWIDFQIMLIGYGHYLQFIYALLGVIIVISSLVPSVKTYYLNAQE